MLGNSLGPLPRAARADLGSELDAWAGRGVESYFEEPARWYDLDTRYRAAMSRIVGAEESEVALMNGLTVNLHLLLASFFRPEGRRRRILIERPAFPSDRYVVETQLRWHGIDPADGIVEVGGEWGGIREEEIEEILAAHGDEIALVFLGGVNFLSGEVLDLGRITRAAHAAGCVAGFDLAHAAGNVPLSLHDGEVDFAAWCTYKYLNSGPGSVGGLFVHRRHASDPDLLRLGGWWGNDPETRFEMQQLPGFVPRADAAGWQLSCPPVLALAPLRSALAMFDEAGMDALRAKSVRLTGYLEWLLAESGAAVEQITPSDPGRRGAQLSFRVRNAAEAQTELSARGVDVDLRKPEVLRLAPAPLFNTYTDVWRAAGALGEVVGMGAP
jgi:kynureninase